MAQLNDLIVTGSSRFLNKIQGTAVAADTATSATTAARLNNTAAVGGAGTPTYFNANGVPAACTLSSIYVGRATADESGNNIKTNYASSLSISNHTITLKSKSGANLASVTVPDNDTTYSLGTSGQYMQLIPDSGDRISVVPNFAVKSARRIFVQGTQTAPTTGGAWTGNCPDILTADGLTDGQEITYWVPLPTTGNVTLNLKFGDGTSSGAVNCYYGGTSRLTTHYGQGQAVHLTYRKNVKIPSTGSTTYTGWWADANYDSNSNTIDVLQGTYTIPVAGGSEDYGQTTTIGVHKYSLFARDMLTGKYASFTKTSGTGNKAEAGCIYDISSIMYANSSNDIAVNGNINTSIVRYAHPLVDFRYTLNITTSSFTARKPLYLIFYAMSAPDIDYSDEISFVAAPVSNSGNGIIWTQDLSTYNPPSEVPADLLMAIEICRAVYDGYRGDLAIKPVYYVFRNSPAFGSNKWVPLTSLTAFYASTAKTLIGPAVRVQYPECTAFQHNTLAEGIYTRASGYYSHAEGYGSTASDESAHAEGFNTSAASTAAHAEGCGTRAYGKYSHAEGYGTTASNHYAHAEGAYSEAAFLAAHAEGNHTVASHESAHAEGYYTSAASTAAHAEGYQTVASSTAAHAEGYQTTASGKYAHAEGQATSAAGTWSHTEGWRTTAAGDGGHAEGVSCLSTDSWSHAEGQDTTASAAFAHAEGNSSIASGKSSHAEGDHTTASGHYSHAEGHSTYALDSYTHAEGYGTTANGIYSHAEGMCTNAVNYYSHAGGYYTIANKNYQTAIGTFNATVNDALFIVGKGSATNRSNAMYVTTAGNINCVSVTQTSDRRLKDDISNISTTDIAIYDKLQPKSFTLKSDDVKSKHYGFIAQDVLQSFEELGLPSSYVGIVHQDQNEQGYYNINYTEFIALLVEKQKIMQQEIDELKAAVAALKQHQS